MDQEGKKMPTQNLRGWVPPPLGSPKFIQRNSYFAHQICS